VSRNFELGRNVSCEESTISCCWSLRKSCAIYPESFLLQQMVKEKQGNRLIQKMAVKTKILFEKNNGGHWLT